MATGAETRAVASTRRLLCLYGAMAQHELNQCLLVDSADPEARQDEIREGWREASAAFRALTDSCSPDPEVIGIREIAGSADHYLRTLEASEQFRRTFSSMPVSFAEVEIDRIIAGQRTVNLDYVEWLRPQIPSDRDGLMRFCLGPGEATATVRGVRSSLTGFSFTSDHPGLALLGAWEAPQSQMPKDVKPGGQPVLAITAVIGFPSSTVNAFKVGKRVILNNGFHRLYALRSLGVTHAPLALLRVDNAEIEMPPSIADLPSSYLAESPRPSMLADFMNESLVCVLAQPTPLKVLQLSWNVNHCIVPKG